MILIKLNESTALHRRVLIYITTTSTRVPKTGLTGNPLIISAEGGNAGANADSLHEISGGWYYSEVWVGTLGHLSLVWDNGTDRGQTDYQVVPWDPYNSTTLGLTGVVCASVAGAVGSVTGNVGGNVAGSVGSVTGNVGGNVNGNVNGTVNATLPSTVNANIVGQFGFVPNARTMMMVLGTSRNCNVNENAGYASADYDDAVTELTFSSDDEFPPNWMAGTVIQNTNTSERMLITAVGDEGQFTVQRGYNGSGASPIGQGEQHVDVFEGPVGVPGELTTVIPVNNIRGWAVNDVVRANSAEDIRIDYILRYGTRNQGVMSVTRGHNSTSPTELSNGSQLLDSVAQDAAGATAIRVETNRAVVNDLLVSPDGKELARVTAIGATVISGVNLTIERAFRGDPDQIEYEQTWAIMEPVITGGEPQAIERNKPYDLYFLMRDSSTKQPATGKAVTAQLKKDGAAFAAATNAVVEQAHGLYRLTINADETACSTLLARFTATDCDVTIERMNPRL